jgi:hypothetical protein
MSKRNSILVLTHWSYQDALIQTYTLPYVRLIRKNIDAERKIILVTFEQEHLKMNASVRKEQELHLRKFGIELLTLEYTKFNLKFPFKALGYLYQLLSTIRKKKVGIIHAWCTPAGSLGYLLSKLTGCDLIIDSYEPHAEAMVENNTWSADSLKFKLLFYLEKKLSKHAKVLISATAGMREYAVRKYNFSPQNFLVKPACVDMADFSLQKKKNKQLLNELNLENKIVAVYAGKFGGIYLTKEVFSLLKEAENKWGEQFRALLLTNHDQQEIKLWAQESGLSLDKIICKFVYHHEVNDYIGLGDFAITPVKPLLTKRYCSPIKDGEYWALGLPVIITKDISDDSAIIETENIGAVLEDLNPIEYKKAIDKIEILLKEGHSLSIRISDVAKKYRSFEIAEEVYNKVYGVDFFKSTV